MSYAVKEVFYTLQGEGTHAGRAAVFCRFAGCNLWTGRESDRAAAVCKFCDTDFVGVDGPDGGKFETAADLANRIDATWPRNSAGKKFVVCTGGEPLLQLDKPLIDALHERNFEIAIETNGTIAAPDGIDWICVSPKADATLIQTRGDELKLVFPQAGASPDKYEQLEFRHFFLQPMDGPDQKIHVEQALRFCLEHPAWRLSLQTHKLVGIR
ncbi:7-carboxy-7-deazaguanine synthase [Acidicapsa ligni]|uniref:7-carboxy-7-deazaguanine synthase n=1 Tax=Acidicapsa ligni TaxID=542300 RepID=UPI0021DF4BFF|nr:7-carboxy-7-deazaguanine synthase [Acidicapsa ligni]